MRVRSIVLASALVGAATFTFSPALAQEADNTETGQENQQNETTTDEDETETQQVEETPAGEDETEGNQAEEEDGGFSDAEEGDFDEIPVTVDPTSGRPGVSVTITAPCDDEDFGAAFLPADKEGEQESDFVEVTDITVSGGTLTARFTIPAGSAAGDALFFVGCGDDIGAADFRVLGAAGTAGPGQAGPAKAVRGEAAFTG